MGKRAGTMEAVGRLKNIRHFMEKLMAWKISITQYGEKEEK